VQKDWHFRNGFPSLITLRSVQSGRPWLSGRRNGWTETAAALRWQPELRSRPGTAVVGRHCRTLGNLPRINASSSFARHPRGTQGQLNSHFRRSNLATKSVLSGFRLSLGRSSSPDTVSSASIPSDRSPRRDLKNFREWFSSFHRPGHSAPSDSFLLAPFFAGLTPGSLCLRWRCTRPSRSQFCR
jgi:hypothetical protein